MFSDDFSEAPTTLIPVETMEDLVWDGEDGPAVGGLDEDDLEEIGRNESAEDREWAEVPTHFEDEWADEPTVREVR